MSISIRPANEQDIDSIISLFYRVYGRNYCFTEVYNHAWQKERIIDPSWLVLIAEEEQRLCAVAITRFNTMTRDDRCGELWINIVDPQYSRRGIATQLTAFRLVLLRGHLNFCYALNVVEHDFTQKLDEQNGMLPVGFLPLRDLYINRQSYIMHSIILPLGRQQRFPNPLIIPEVESLARQVLENFNLPQQYQVADDKKIELLGGNNLTLESIPGDSWIFMREFYLQSPRRIMGRVDLRNDPETLISKYSRTLLARIGGKFVGAVALMIEEENHLLEILDVVGKGVTVIGSILEEVDKRARVEWQIEYAEVNVSTLESQTQRTLYNLGFLPVAYCPAMAVFERKSIDVVRMAKVYRPSKLGQLKVTSAARKISEIVLAQFHHLNDAVLIEQ